MLGSVLDFTTRRESLRLWWIEARVRSLILSNLREARSVVLLPAFALAAESPAPDRPVPRPSLPEPSRCPVCRCPAWSLAMCSLCGRVHCKACRAGCA